MTDLGTFGGSRSWAYAINRLGQVVGEAQMADGDDHAFLWQDGVMTDLGTLGGTQSQAYDVNSLGQVVGHTTWPPHAFVWEEGVMTDLGISYRADLINDAGHIVGRPYSNSWDDQAVLWRDDGIVDLGTLGWGGSKAEDMNDIGQIVGWSNTAAREQHAVLWQDGAITDLGTLEGRSQSKALAINEAGQIVGHCSRRAFVWQNGAMTDLGTLVGGESQATGINGLGQIIGVSHTGDGIFEDCDGDKVSWCESYSVAVLWQPAP